MRIYKIEISIINFDNLPEDEIVSVIENAHYPNHCISPEVRKIESRDIGEWKDSHPLNYRSSFEEEYKRLFGDK